MKHFVEQNQGVEWVIVGERSDEGVEREAIGWWVHVAEDEAGIGEVAMRKGGDGRDAEDFGGGEGVVDAAGFD